MNKINVLYYEPTSGFGGSSRCLLSWLKKMSHDEYNQSVLVHHDGPAIKKIKDLGVKAVKIPFVMLSDRLYLPPLSYFLLIINLVIYYIPSAFFILVYASMHKIQLLHLNAKIISVIPGIIAARISGIPCICHLHDTKYPARIERFFAKGVDCFVVLTEKAYQLYSNIYPTKKIELVHNGIDLDSYNALKVNKERVRHEFDIKGNQKVIGIAGRMVEGKGFSDFIAAAKIITSKFDAVKFLIVGSSPEENKEYEKYLKKLVRDLDLREKVIFTGWRDNIKEVMSIFDILIQASSTFPEGFGLTCIEAMALSKPVVVTNVPGPSEIIVDGETGYIVPKSNPEELAKAIGKIINSDDLALKMGKAGRKRVESYFSLENVVDKIEAIYGRILDQEDSNG